MTFSARGVDHDDWVELIFITGPFTEGKGFESDTRVIDEPSGMSILTDGNHWCHLSNEERDAMRDYFLGKLPLVHAPEKEE